MARIRLISKVLVIHGNDAVEDPDLLRAFTPSSETLTDLNLKRLPKLSLVPIEIGIKS